MTNKPILSFLAIALILPISASAMNLLTNPSFEGGTGAVTFSSSTEFGGAAALELTSPSTEMAGWKWEQTGATTGGAAWLEETGDVFGTDGTHLLFLDSNQCIQWNDAVVVSADEVLKLDYNFAAWERGQDNTAADSGDATALLEYNYRDTNDVVQFGSYTGPGDIVAPGNTSNGPGSLVWINGSWNFTVPSDYSADFNFQITTTGGMLLDDLSITAVPESGTTGLFGLTLVMFALRRRRRG